MNLKKVTLRYMGWCPGVESAARFLPDRDMSRGSLILTGITSASILIVAGLIVLSFYKPPEWRSLTVTIDGVTYLDEEFNESFDYSSLKGKYVHFTILRNISEFSTSGKFETQIYDFEELGEAWLFLEELDTPRIVIGFARWLSNTTFREAYKEFYGRDPMEIEDYPSTPEISLLFGNREAQQCHFGVDRGPSTGGLETNVNGTDGICIFKREMGIGRSIVYWLLYIRLNDTPPYPVVFCRYPYPAR